LLADLAHSKFGGREMSDWYRVIPTGGGGFLIGPADGSCLLPLLLAIICVPILLLVGGAIALMFVVIEGALFLGFITTPYLVLIGEANPLSLFPFGGFWLIIAFALVVTIGTIKWGLANRAERKDAYAWLLLIMFLPMIFVTETMLMLITNYLGQVGI